MNCVPLGQCQSVPAISILASKYACARDEANAAETAGSADCEFSVHLQLCSLTFVSILPTASRTARGVGSDEGIRHKTHRGEPEYLHR
jgi:hypothetical protein